jgi:hypothetical protein
MTYNPKIKNVSSKVTKVESEYLRADKIYLDIAQDPADSSDSTYTDGLFVDFQDDPRNTLDGGRSGITIGTAIDRFNEVLSGLAPPPAPKLSTLNSEEAGGKEENVAFGTVQELKYGDVDTVTPEDLPIVENHNVYQKKSSGGDFIRLGMFAEKKQLVIVLNGTVQQNLQGDEENYPDNSFDTTKTILPSDLTVQMLDVNGDMVPLTDDPLPYTISITPDPTSSNYEPNYGRFASAKDFKLFNSSVGTVTLSTDAPWRRGYNRLKVIGQGIETTVVEWAYVPNESSENQYDFQYLNVNPSYSGTKYISGIRYCTGIEYRVGSTSKILNYAIDSYPQVVDGYELGYWVSSDTSAIPTKTQFGLLAAKNTKVDLNNNILNIGSTTIETDNSDARTINADNSIQTPVLTFNVKNSFGKEKIYPITLQKTLFDSYSTADQPLNLQKQQEFENFNNETMRVKLDLTPWDSALPLGDNDALVFNGQLMHSKKIGADAEDVGLPSQPNAGTLDFSSRVNKEYFYRVFQHVSALNKLWLDFVCNGTVTFTDASGVGVSVEFSVNGGTDWYDAVLPSTIGNGIAAGTLLSSTNRTMEVDFAAKGTTPTTNNASGGNDLYMRIGIPSSTTGTIDTIKIKYINTISDVPYDSTLE